jgi:hypothetical protein
MHTWRDLNVDHDRSPTREGRGGLRGTVSQSDRRHAREQAWNGNIILDFNCIPFSLLCSYMRNLLI